jgi:putative transposase
MRVVLEPSPTELPLDALEMALWVRGRAGQDVTGVIHHSDAGSQYTAIRYRSRLDDVGALASIGTVADSYDNGWPRPSSGCTRPNASTAKAPGETPRTSNWPPAPGWTGSTPTGCTPPWAT